MPMTNMGERASFVCDVAGCFLTVRVRGEIDHHTAVNIRNGIDATLFEKRPRRLILDLSAVSFMDSSGLGLIMGRYSVMKELGGDLVVYNPSRETRSILTLAGMERIVKIECPEGDQDTESRGRETRKAPRTLASRRRPSSTEGQARRTRSKHSQRKEEQSS